jgi:hypothetical protein
MRHSLCAAKKQQHQVRIFAFQTSILVEKPYRRIYSDAVGTITTGVIYEA